MDTFSACVALLPLAIYLLLLGMINLSGRPLVVNGTREILAFGLAIAGLVIVGPMQLFMPEGAAAWFGGLVWVLLIGFSVLCLALAIMVSRPRLVIYNISLEQLRPILTETVARLDHDSSWANRAVSMPQMRVYLQVESFPPLRNASLVATGNEQSVAGWRRLETALRETLRETPVVGQTHGIWLALCGVMILLALALRIAEDPQTIAQGLDRMLNP
jgi:hypothetical protein